MAEASVAVAGQVATAHELGGGLPVGPPCGVQAGFRCGVLLGGEHTAEPNAAPRRGSLRTFELSMDEWLDAIDESTWTWIGTPPPTPYLTDAAWGPWDENSAWWNYPQAEARAYRNQRFFPVPVLGAVPAGGLPLATRRAVLPLGEPGHCLQRLGPLPGQQCAMLRLPSPMELAAGGSALEGHDSGATLAGGGVDH